MIRKLVLCLLSALVLAGCSHINFWTALKFANTDFLDVNPETARIALVVGKGAPIDTVIISVSGEKDGKTVLEYQVDLEVVREGPELAELPTSIPRDQTLVIRVPPDDVKRVLELQIETARFLENDGNDNSLSVGINFGSDQNAETDVCAEQPDQSSIAIWVRLDRGEAYSRLISERAFAKIVEESIREQCGAARSS